MYDESFVNSVLAAQSDDKFNKLVLEARRLGHHYVRERYHSADVPHSYLVELKFSKSVIAPLRPSPAGHFANFAKI